MAEMKRTLGLASAAAIVIGSMVGSGIFLVTPKSAVLMGNPGWLILLWVITGIVTILGATSYGKLAAYMPEAGGQYVFLRRAWGNIPAFLYGWVFFWVIQTGFIAAVAVAFSRYLGVLLPAISTETLFMLPMGIPFNTEKLIAVVTLLSLTWFNTRGAEAGALLQNIFTSLKVLALIALIAIGLSMGQELGHISWALTPLPDEIASAGLLSAIAVAAVGPLFSSDAWNYVTFIGGEVKNPSQTLPKALVLGASTVVCLYVLVNLAYLNVLPLDVIKSVPDDKVAAAMMTTLFGSLGGKLIAAIILVSTFGCLNGMILSGARVFYAMAQDGLLFKPFAALHPTTQSPNISLWAQCAWGIVLALSGNYGLLLDYIIFTALVFYIVTMAGLLKLARHNNGELAPRLNMHTLWDYAPPVLYIIAASILSAYMLLSASTQTTSVIGVAITLTGLPVYWLWQQYRPASA